MIIPSKSAKDEYWSFDRYVNIETKDKLETKTTIKTSDYAFMQPWTQSLLPICMQDSFSLPTDCSDFKPSFTNEGLGFTRNGADLDKIFYPSSYMNNFQRIMLYNKSTSNIRPIKGSGINYQYSFLVNAQRYKDLKRGIKWNQTSRSKIKLAVHSPMNIADMKGLGVNIYPGYVTTIRVDMVELVSNDDIRGLNIKKRQCRFHDEPQDLQVVKHYSTTNCLFECSMDAAEDICGCRPWDYPRPKSSNENTSNKRICDFFGSSCFNKMMKTDKIEVKCRKECDSDCEEIKYSLSVDRSPIESQDYVCLHPRKRDKNEKNVQKSIWNHIFGEPLAGNGLSWFQLTNSDRILRIVQDALMNPNKTTDLEEFCTKKVTADIAVVEVIINSPTVLRLIQSVKVSFVEKLANFGKVLIYDQRLNCFLIISKIKRNTFAT